MVTFTEPITTTSVDLLAGAYTWFTKATNAVGVSASSTTWSFNVLGKIFLPITRK